MAMGHASSPSQKENPAGNDTAANGKKICGTDKESCIFREATHTKENFMRTKCMGSVHTHSPTARFITANSRKISDMDTVAWTMPMVKYTKGVGRIIGATALESCQAPMARSLKVHLEPMNVKMVSLKCRMEYSAS